jgi:hypothetical protein
MKARLGSALVAYWSWGFLRYNNFDIYVHEFTINFFYLIADFYVYISEKADENFEWHWQSYLASRWFESLLWAWSGRGSMQVKK